MEYRRYKRVGEIEAVEYKEKDLNEFPWGMISVSVSDKLDGSPKEGDYIARNPNNHNNTWLINKGYFNKYYRDVDTTEEEVNEIIKENKDSIDMDKISDTFHTFGELYEARLLYNACLFNEWVKSKKYDVHKSFKHNDGKYCFDSNGEWFIVVANLPSGQISNHYPKKDWDLFDIPAVEKAKYKFDGHSTEDIFERLRDLC